MLLRFVKGNLENTRKLIVNFLKSKGGDGDAASALQKLRDLSESRSQLSRYSAIRP